MIRLDGLSKQFGSRVLFRDLSWTLPAGARLGLVGPNGAGKTTLLRILAGRETADAGRVIAPRGLEVGYLPQEVETVEGSSVLSAVLAGFAELARIEEELEALERRMAELAPGDPATDPLTARYGDLRQRFELAGGDTVEARARAVLGGLGVGADRFHAPLTALSGGWRMRVVLARLLVGRPGLLLLDEPTNHLDLEAIEWLEGFLAGYDGAWVVVSHDRYFLNRLVSGVLELEHGRLTAFPGGYDDYLAERERRAEALEEAARRQERERARIERFVERFRYKATKARQVQSRLRALDKLETVERAQDTRRIHFGFPAPPRSGDIVLRMEGVDKRFDERCVFEGLDLLLRRGDRVALVGPNGAGKSTLLRLAAGRLAPDAGRIELGQRVIARYYSQHQLDALDAEATALEELERLVAPGERPRLRTLLGAFLFAGDDVDKRVGVLSGGEKARLALAKLLVRPANLLLLDEPTNHLDLRSREVLEDALDAWEGTLVVVSHDRYFINRIATAIGEVGGGAIELWEGDYDEWSEARRRRAEREAAAAPDDASSRASGAAVGEGTRDSKRDARRREAEERNRRYREKTAFEKRLAPLEQEIGALEQRLAELDRSLADPAVYSDPARAAETGRERAGVAERLGRLYEAWEAAAAAPPED